MSVLYIFSSISLITFMILATYDGVYLHLWKYELFDKKESYFEHLTHTTRAILFPIIIALLLIYTSKLYFIIGIGLVIIDLIILGLDAYSEKESRAFMGGLPKWEYILHLFANSLHFTTFILIIISRLQIEDSGIQYSFAFESNKYFYMSKQLAQFILPGSILLAFIHILLLFKNGKMIWKNLFKRFNRSLKTIRSSQSQNL